MCINSICGQTYTDLDIIIIDDGSNDNSWHICEKYKTKDSRIRLIHQQNAGVSAARNRGIDLAEGEAIVFVDSDDCLESDYIKKLLQNYQKDALCICGYFAEFVQKGKNYTKAHVYSMNESQEHLRKENVIQIFQKSLLNPVWNKIYCAALIKEKNIRFQENLNLGEDLLFNLDYLNECNNNIVMLNIPLYHYYRWGRVSLDNSYNEKYASSQKILYTRFLSFARELTLPQKDLSHLYYAYFNSMITAMDNVYKNKCYLGIKCSKEKRKNIKENYLPVTLISYMYGKEKAVAMIRLCFIRIRLYPLDYFLRTLIKKLLRLE